MEIFLLGRFDVRVDGRRDSAVGVEPPAGREPGQVARPGPTSTAAPRAGDGRAVAGRGAVDEATPRLHKAAHFARRVLGPDSVALRNESGAAVPGTAR